MGQFFETLHTSLSEDSTDVAFTYARFGVAFIEFTPYVLEKSLCNRLKD